jgi:hypothetical protein
MRRPAGRAQPGTTTGARRSPGSLSRKRPTESARPGGRRSNPARGRPAAVVRFTGEYDAAGEPRWSKGELLVESVYRFKGQSAAAVVVTELVLSERAEACLSAALGEARDG